MNDVYECFKTKKKDVDNSRKFYKAVLVGNEKWSFENFLPTSPSRFWEFSDYFSVKILRTFLGRKLFHPDFYENFSLYVVHVDVYLYIVYTKCFVWSLLFFATELCFYINGVLQSCLGRVRWTFFFWALYVRLEKIFCFEGINRCGWRVDKVFAAAFF